MLNRMRKFYRDFDHRYPLRGGHPVYRPFFLLRASMSRRFYLELNHGLANRLTALVSCQVACDELGRELRIIWNVNRHCGCDFDDLFSNSLFVDPFRRVVDFNDDTTCRPAFLSSRKSFLFTGQGIDRFDKCDRGAPFLNNLPFISGCRDSVAEEFSHRLNMLEPVPEVCALIPEIPENSVGVHIRRTDLPWQTRSTTDEFVDRMRQTLDCSPDVVFFLATDDAEVKAHISRKFGAKVLCVPNSGHRKSIEGVRVALAELIALSKTQRVLGTFNSSFSWLATMWRLIDLDIVGLATYEREREQA